MECDICVSLFPQNEFVIFDCTHQVCITCFSKLLEYNKPCPFCRAVINNIRLETYQQKATIEYRIGFFCGKWLFPISVISFFFYIIKSL